MYFRGEIRYLAKTARSLRQEDPHQENFGWILKLVAQTADQLGQLLNEVQNAQRLQFQWKLLYIAMAARLLGQECLAKQEFEQTLQTLLWKIDKLEQLLTESCKN